MSHNSASKVTRTIKSITATWPVCQRCRMKYAPGKTCQCPQEPRRFCDAPPRVDGVAYRTCLKCGKQFKSEGSWNRICPRCAGIQERSIKTVACRMPSNPTADETVDLAAGRNMRSHR